MLRSRNSLLSGYICRRCTHQLAKHFASNSSNAKNPTQSNPHKPPTNSKPPLFSSSPSPAQNKLSPSSPAQKNVTPHTQTKPFSSSHAVKAPVPPPLFPSSPATTSKNSVPPPLFSSSSPSSPSSPSTSPPSEFLSLKSAPPKSPFAPPILTPKPRPKNSTESTSYDDEISRMRAQEIAESERHEKFRLAQIKARNEIFAPKNSEKENSRETSSEAENYRELRNKAYEELIRSSYVTPPPKPLPKITPTKEEIEAKQKEVVDDLDKYMDNYEGVLAEVQAKTMKPRKPLTPTVSPTPTHPPSSIPISSRHSPSPSPSPSRSPSPSSPPMAAKVNTHAHPNHKKHKKHGKGVPGESAKFSKSENSKFEKRPPPVGKSALYAPKPVDEKEKVEREGDLPKGLETRATKIQEFLQYTQRQVAQGKMPEQNRMRGLFEVSVPSKEDLLTSNLKGFADHQAKLKSERQKK